MKSAMQELLEWHRKSMRSYSETNKMIEALLEKEKEQILAAYNNGSQDMALEEKYEPLEYYNQTYNQNK